MKTIVVSGATSEEWVRVKNNNELVIVFGKGCRTQRALYKMETFFDKCVNLNDILTSLAWIKEIFNRSLTNPLSLVERRLGI